MKSKDTFEKLGIPQAERQYLAGVKAQFESEVVYGSLKEDLSKQGLFSLTPIRRFVNTPICCVSILEPSSPIRQQVRGFELGGVVGRFVYLRSQRCQNRLPAPSLLPNQMPKYGAVRADPYLVDEGASVHYVEVVRLQCIPRNRFTQRSLKLYASVEAVAVFHHPKLG